MSGALKLSWPVRTRAELQLRTYCDRRVPRHAVRQVRTEFEIRGLSAMNRREACAVPSEEWTRLPIAKFRFDLESTCPGPSSLSLAHDRADISRRADHDWQSAT